MYNIYLVYKRGCESHNVIVYSQLIQVVEIFSLPPSLPYTVYGVCVCIYKVYYYISRALSLPQ